MELHCYINQELNADRNTKFTSVDLKELLFFPLLMKVFISLVQIR